MNIKEAVISALKELIIPELNSIREENREIKAILTLTNKRLDDHNAHLTDLSRRIDETNKRIDGLKVELKEEISKNTSRIDEINKRIDRLYEVIVKKEEHIDLVVRVTKLEEKLKEIEVRVTP